MDRKDEPAISNKASPAQSPTTSQYPAPPTSFADRNQANNSTNTNSTTAANDSSAHVRSQAQPSPAIADRVFPIRSVVSVDPTSTPAPRSGQSDGYFQHARASDARRLSNSTEGSVRNYGSSRKASGLTPSSEFPPPNRQHPPRLPHSYFNEIVSARNDDRLSDYQGASTVGASSVKSAGADQDMPGIITARFKHVVTEDGHAIVTGRDGDTLQRCEDEPIHIPGAIQGFGLLIAFQEVDGRCKVRIVSENSKKIIGYTPQQLFALDSFTDILSDDQADNLLDHIDFIRDEECDVVVNGPEVFTISIRTPRGKNNKLWCGMHVNDRNPGLIICEFELEDDQLNPLVPPADLTPDVPEDTLNSNPTAEELLDSTQNISRPLRVLRSARKRKGEAAAMEVFNIMSQVQEQLAAAPNLETFLKVLVGVVKELTGFHRIMIYQFDQSWNGRVVTELVDPRATLDLYKGLNFPASDIPKQARDMYRVNKVRLLYDRDLETARLVCRTTEDLETPLDMTYAYLRAMSPIHIKYLGNMAVRASMSISIQAFDELWGLIACHSYGPRGMRVSFPIRKMCRLVGDSASRNIERLSYASRLQARKLINTAPTQANPSGYIVASSDDLLKLFNADFGLLSIRDETKILGHLEQSHEPLAMLEYLRMRKLTSVTSSQDVTQDFPDLKYAPGFSVVAGMLVVPLSAGGNDFIVFFRKGQLREVRWAGNPYEKFIKEGTEGYLEPRKSFKTWCETIVGRCKEWTEEEIETAAVLCLVYGRFIEVWRQKEAALQNSQLTRLLLANSAHEVRTPLNAIINYLEIAMEGSLDQETRENLAKSHSASKSLIYVINDLLDLTKTEEGVELIKGDTFDLQSTLQDASSPFGKDAKRKNIDYEVVEHPDIPQLVIGDHRRVRQAISNVIANAIQHTSVGGVKVEMYVCSRTVDQVEVEIVVEDTGVGMSAKKMDSLFRELEQVSSETESGLFPDQPRVSDGKEAKKALGLGLAVVARVVRNMNGQLRLKSEEGHGSKFIIQLPFDLPDGEQTEESSLTTTAGASIHDVAAEPTEGEVIMVAKGPDRPYSNDSTLPMLRKNSTESLNSRRSLRSLTSHGSGQSGKSDVDRLIEAIQEPHMLSGKRPSSTQSSRPRTTKRFSYGGSASLASPDRPRSADRQSLSSSTALKLSDATSIEGFSVDQSQNSSPATQFRALKLPDGTGSPVVPHSLRTEPMGSIIGEADEITAAQAETYASPATNKHELGGAGEQDKSASANPVEKSPVDEGRAADAKHMRVLVAEDDPVNVKILRKRMERFGHEIHVTTNGEECASALGDKPGTFDAVLMDMQMPIVDGLTSTKMIRSLEKTQPDHKLSPCAQKNGRIPVIAVSASLEERDRQTYIDAGFDAWILKPVNFTRLDELLSAAVDKEVREKCLYKPGMWEKGGWFESGSRNSKTEANTKPSSDKVPVSGASKETQVAAANDGPAADPSESLQDEEQARLLKNQERMKEKEDIKLSKGKRRPTIDREGQKLDHIAGNDVSIVDELK